MPATRRRDGTHATATDKINREPTVCHGAVLGRALGGAGKALGKGVKAADDLIDGPVTGGIRHAADTSKHAVNRVSKGIADRTTPAGQAAGAGSNDLISQDDDPSPMIFGNRPAKRDENQPIRVTKDDQVYPMDDKETGKILHRLDPGESVVMSVRQSRVKPGGAAVLNPNTIFVTEKRIIIRSPTRMGLGENIEEYEYGVIKNIHLEKGMMSASVVFFIDGLTEISKKDRKSKIWGRNAAGTIDAIPKPKAEALYRYVRAKIQEVKKRGMKVTFDMPAPQQQQEDPMSLLQKKYINGEITREQFLEMKKDLGL